VIKTAAPALVRFFATLGAVVVAYLIAVALGPNLPSIKIRTDVEAPATLDSILSNYVIHEPDEELHLLRYPRPAQWDGPEGQFDLYDLANAVPAKGSVYSTAGGQVESLYETFLLSIKAGNNPKLDALQRSYREAKRRSNSRLVSSKERRRRERVTEEALAALVAYSDIIGNQSGPAPLALGKAVSDYYGQVKVQIALPNGDGISYRTIETSPALKAIRGSTILPTVDVAVPATLTAEAKIPTVTTGKVQQLKIAELTIIRPWIDYTLLKRTLGPWVGEDPKIFGLDGTFQRLPVRLLLAQRPTVLTASSKVETTEGGNQSVSFGPFSYDARDATAEHGRMVLRPNNTNWIVLGVISKQL